MLQCLGKGNTACRMKSILQNSPDSCRIPLVFNVPRPEIAGRRITLAFSAFASHPSSPILYCPLSCLLAVASGSFCRASFSVTSRTYWSRRTARTCVDLNDNSFRSSARFGWRMVSRYRSRWRNDLIRDDGNVLCHR